MLYREVPLEIDVETKSSLPSILDRNAQINANSTIQNLTFLPGTKVVARLIDGNQTLELRLISMAKDASLSDSEKRMPVRFNLPGVAIPRIQIVEESDNLHVMVVTTSGIVCRLVFPKPCMFYTDPLPTGFSIQFRSRLLSSRTPTLFHAADLDTLLVACQDGSLIHIECPRDDLMAVESSGYEEFEVVEAKQSQRGAMRWLGRAREDNLNQVVDLATVIVGDKTWALVLSKDGQLRLFDLTEHRCTWTMPGVDGMSLQPGRYIRFIDDANQTGSAITLADGNCTAVVYQPKEDTEFLWLQGGREGGLTFNQTTSISYPLKETEAIPGVELVQEDLVDFDLSCHDYISSLSDAMEVSSWTVWTLWKRNKETLLRFATIQDGTWHDVITETRLDLDLPDLNTLANGPRGIAEIFVDHIFYPGRFSPSVIQYALDLTENNVINQSNDLVDLKTRVVNGIGRGLILNDYQETYESFPSISRLLQAQERLLTAWQEFLSLCIELQQVANTPVGLNVDNVRHGVTIVKRLGLSTIRVCDQIELIDHYWAHEEDRGEFQQKGNYMEQCYPDLAQTGFLQPFDQNPIQRYYSVAQQMLNMIPEDVIVALEDDVTQQLARPRPVSVKHFLDELIERHGLTTVFTENVEDVRQFVSLTHDLIESCPNFFTDMMDLLRADSGVQILRNSVPHWLGRKASPRHSYAGDQPLPDHALTPVGDFTLRIVDSSLHQIVECRYRTSWLVFFVLLILCMVDQEGITMPLPRLYTCMEDAKRVLSVYVVLRWLSCSLVYPPTPQNGLKGIKTLQHINGMLSKEHLGLKSAMTSEVSASLAQGALNSLHQSSFGELSHGRACRLSLVLLNFLYPVLLDLDDLVFPSAIVAAVDRFLDETGIRPEISQRDRRLSLTTQFRDLDAAYARLGKVLYDTNLLKSLGQLLNLLPLSSATAHLRGLWHLSLNEPILAGDFFRKAAIGFLGKKPGMPADDDTRLPLLLPTEVYTRSSLGYYQHIMQLFDDRMCHEMSVLFAQLAMNALGDAEKPSLVAQIQRMIFIGSLQLLRFDDAYSALFAIPDAEIRRTCLQRFITVVCENHQMNRLYDYDFRGLQYDLESSLRYVSTNSSPLDKPNYYKVLYGYYIRREDYRAGTYARRETDIGLAAETMYTFATRLAGISPNQSDYVVVIKDHLNALLAALNALESAKDGYIVARPVKPSTDNMDVDEPRAKRVKTSGITEEKLGHARVIGKEELRKEITIAEGRLQVAMNKVQNRDKVAGLIASQLDAQALVRMAINSGLIDGATTVAQVNQLSLEPIAESIVDMCMRVTNAEKSGRSIDERDLSMIQLFQDANQRFGMVSGEGMTERAWKVLLQYLSENSGENLQGYCVDRILGTDWRMTLAPWLVQKFEENPQDLLRLYIKYHRIEDAAIYAKRVLGSRGVEGRGTFGKWLPYPLLDQLFDLLKHGEGGKVQGLARDLKDVIERNEQEARHETAELRVSR